MHQLLTLWQSTIRSTRSLLILAITLFHAGLLSSQCMMIPLPLSNQVAKSELIVEGVVKEKSAFIAAADNFIYTTYQIEITKIFKGQLHSSTVQVVELGGQVGKRAVEVTPSIKLEVGETGTYFLENYTFRDPQDGLRYSEPVYRAYASSQSVFSYDLYSNTVAGHFNQYGLDDWYGVLTNATGASFKEVKELARPERDHSRMAPTISSMTPLNITAGTFSVLTINGNGFGATQGTSTVEFKNADDGGGTWFVASAVHTLTWTNTQITIRVPYSGGSGQVRVTVAAMPVTSSQSLAIAYNQYSVEFNLPPATLFRRHLYNNNGAGGYTFRYHTELNGNVAARKSFERALNSWRCGTEVNFIVGDVTTLDVLVQDGTNVVRFDNGEEIPAGVGAQTYSYFDDCANIVLFATHIMEIDLVFNDAFAGITWEYGPDLPTATEVDFESIALHELGHACALGHVISAPEVMHYSIGPGEAKRVLSANDIAGGIFVHNQSTGNGAWCGNNPMTDYRQVKYVNSATTGIQSGDTWAQAYKYLQDALTTVTSCVDTIYVASGFYYPDEGTGMINNDQTHKFNLNQPVVVMGSYNASNGARQISIPSYLSGDIDLNAVTDGNNSQNVVRMSSTATLDGFFIERGYADAASGEGRDGAGLYVSSNGIIRNCVFRQNNALNRGGAVFQLNSSPQFTNCLFYINNATTSGTAFHSAAGSMGCTNCTIVSNTQAGIAALKVDNGTHQFRNSIFWNNTSDMVITSPGSVDLSYSIIQSASLPSNASGSNVLFNTDPLFINLAASNFNLLPCSPATNTGNNAYNNTTIDLNGGTRIIAGTIDRGPYENGGPPTTVVSNTADSGAGSLRSIIANACTGNTITFSPSLLNQTILLTGVAIDINKNLIIDGLGIDQLTISANATHRHFNQLAGFTTTIRNLKLSEGNAATNGNCISNLGTLTLENIRLHKSAGAANPITLSNTGGTVNLAGQVYMQ